MSGVTSDCAVTSECAVTSDSAVTSDCHTCPWLYHTCTECAGRMSYFIEFLRIAMIRRDNSWKNKDSINTERESFL